MSSPPRDPSRLERYARGVIRWRWPIVVAWAVVVVVGALLATRIGDVTTSQVTLPGTESQRGLDLLRDSFGGGETTSVQPVFRNAELTVRDPAYAEAVTASLARAAEVVPGTQVVSLYSTGSPDLASEDGHLTYAVLRLPLEPERAKTKVTPIREALRDGLPAEFEVLVGGQAASDNDLAPLFDEDLRRAEVVAFPLALLILVFAFGTLVSALLPLAVAGVTITGALGSVYLVGQAMDLSIFVTNVVLLIGLGVGIDYALLMVGRFREEMGARCDREQALVRTVATAGHSVIFSGTAVAIGLAVLVLLNVPFIRSMGIAGMLVPIFAVAAGLTLLPALLYILGPRVDLVRVLPARLLLGGGGAGWDRLARGIMRAAVPVFAVTSLLMLALAIPSTALSVNQDALEDAPQQAEAIHAGLVLREALGGAANPDIVVIDGGAPGALRGAERRATLTAFANELRAREDVVRGVTWPARTPTVAELARSGLLDSTGRVALMNVAPLGDALSTSGRALNDLLEARADGLAAALGGDVKVLLTGEPALLNDFNHAIYGPFPWLVLLVLALTYVALLRAFRSVVLPVKAVIMNLLSILATYGLIVVVFQWGVGNELLGMDYEVRGIASWIPVFLFAFLFGLSMDYEVFLISRMRELYDGGAPTHEAVANGLRHTGRIVTSAALIMVVAFGGFVLGRATDLKVFGFGLAAAILIDATVVRMLLVPSLMRLMGRWNWVLPAPVARLARVAPSERRPGAGARA